MRFRFAFRVSPSAILQKFGLHLLALKKLSHSFQFWSGKFFVRIHYKIRTKATPVDAYLLVLSSWNKYATAHWKLVSASDFEFWQFLTWIERKTPNSFKSWKFLYDFWRRNPVVVLVQSLGIWCQPVRRTCETKTWARASAKTFVGILLDFWLVILIFARSRTWKIIWTTKAAWIKNGRRSARTRRIPARRPSLRK